MKKKIIPKNNLKNVRKSKNLTAQQLGNLMGIKREYISDLENGRYEVTMSWAIKLAKILDCTPADILGFENLGIARIESKESPNNNVDNDSKLTTSSKESASKPLYQKKDYVTVNMYTQEMSCGAGIEPFSCEQATPIVLDRYLLREFTLNTQYVIIVRAIGDSMSPLIKDKSFVLIDTADIEIKNSKDNLKNVFAFKSDNDLCIKHLTLNKKTNTIKAVSSNSDKIKYPDKKISLNETSDFKIIGRVLATFNYF